MYHVQILYNRCKKWRIINSDKIFKILTFQKCLVEKFNFDIDVAI